MSKLEKAKDRLKLVPKDYTYNEAKSLLVSIGYEEYNKGKTSGSRVMFIKRTEEGIKKIVLHKPHPDNEMKHYAVRDLKENLIMNGDL